MYGCRAAVPYMLKKGSGSIINIASTNGLVANPSSSIYSASKGAVVQFTKGVALDYGKQGIRCNAICPGWIDTPINYPLIAELGGKEEIYGTIGNYQAIPRFGEPHEVAQLALFLASDESSYLTGSIIAVDGGLTAM